MKNETLFILVAKNDQIPLTVHNGFTFLQEIKISAPIHLFIH